MPHHIAWFSGAPVEPCEKDGLTSPDADVRSRCLLPARELEKLGVACSVFGNLEEADPTHVSKHLQKLGTDIVVIGKMSSATLLKLARAAKHLGCYVIADFADHSELSLLGQEFFGVIDRVVTATPALAEIINQEDNEVMVIADADPNNPRLTAECWYTCFLKLREKPPVCANTNIPLAQKI